MERYNKCNIDQKKILDTLFWYLGFNEATSFDKYIEFMYANTREGISFENMINHAIGYIATCFRNEYPEYKTYIKFNWLKYENMTDHMKVGSGKEFDPKGLVRFYVRNNFDRLASEMR